jgi:hypothetical protein
MKAANTSLGALAGLLFLASPAMAEGAGDAAKAVDAEAAGDAGAGDWHFQGSVSFVYLDRDGPPDSLIVNNTVTGDPVLEGSAFDTDWDPGVDLRLGLGYSEWGIEGRFFGGFAWDDSSTLTTPAIFDFPTAPPLFGLGTADLDAKYTSRLDSLEANLLWRPMERVTVLGGVRWLDLTDRLVADLDFGANAAKIRFDNRADGFGPQLGARVRVLDFTDAAVPLFFDVEGTVGAIRLKHRADFSVAQEIGPGFEADGRRHDWTFLGELGANLGLHVTDNLEMALGYRLIYVDEAPSAVGQAPGVDIISQNVDPETHSLFAHGVDLGFTLSF